MEVLRKEYFQRLLAWKDKKMIKVVTGIRRCGKSTLLRMFRDYLLEHGIEENQIISINFEDYEYQELWQPKALYLYMKERILPGKMTYLFLDEIQNVKEFQRVVDSFFLRDNVDIYITGSNSYMIYSDRDAAFFFCGICADAWNGGPHRGSLPGLYRKQFFSLCGKHSV